eukprot:181282_1
MAQSQTKKIRVKVRLGSLMFVWRPQSNKSIQLSELNDFVTTNFSVKANTFRVNYEDDESLECTMLNDPDLNDAFDTARDENRKSLKIKVERKVEVIDLSSSITIPKIEPNTNTNSNNSNTNQHIQQQVNTQMNRTSITTTSLHTIP